MGRTYRTCVWFLLVVLHACSTSTEPEGCRSSGGRSDVYNGEYMFQECTALTITANRSEFGLLESVKVTFACLPTFDGTGVLRVQLLPQKQSSAYQGVIIDAPKVQQIAKYWYQERIRLESGKRFQTSWLIRVQDKTKHFLYGAASFDSVCIDTVECYQIRSEEARDLFGWLDTRPAANYPGYELAEPMK